MIHEMTETTGWSRRRAARTEAIVAAGLQLVASDGLDALTVGGLSKAVGMTPGALYRYFPSKDAILAELNHRVVARWAAHFATVLADVAPDDPPLVRVAVAGVAFADLAAREPEALALLALTTADPRMLVAEPEPRHVPPMLALLTTIGAMVDAADLRPGDGRHRATMLVFGLLGVLQTGKLVRFDPVFAPKALAHGVLHDLLVGWGAPPDLASAAIQRASTIVLANLRST
ncbi:MAG: AcrR family transcriptional regulator [Myxococcota bacterium]|jgi:AcrR family transcriptional regulator